MKTKSNPMNDYLSSAWKSLERLGYKRFTCGISHTLKQAFQAGENIDTAVSEVQDIFSPDGNLMPGCYYNPEGDGTFVKGDSIPPKETQKTSNTEPPVDPGAALFEAYATAKQNLTEKLKAVLQILFACDALEVEHGDKNYITSYIGKNTKDIASHQWRYCAGHEKIYCQHTYRPQYSHSFTTTMVKVPVKYLGMNDDEIWADNEKTAIKALEEKKASYEKKRSEMLKPIDAKITEVDKQINMLKEHKIGGK